MIERANNPAELRQLLKEEGLADNLLLGFDDEDLQPSRLAQVGG